MGTAKTDGDCRLSKQSRFRKNKRQEKREEERGLSAATRGFRPARGVQRGDGFTVVPFPCSSGLDVDEIRRGIAVTDGGVH